MNNSELRLWIQSLSSAELRTLFVLSGRFLLSQTSEALHRCGFKVSGLKDVQIQSEKAGALSGMVTILFYIPLHMFLNQLDFWGWNVEEHWNVSPQHINCYTVYINTACLANLPQTAVLIHSRGLDDFIRSICWALSGKRSVSLSSCHSVKRRAGPLLFSVCLCSDRGMTALWHRHVYQASQSISEACSYVRCPSTITGTALLWLFF